MFCSKSAPIPVAGFKSGILYILIKLFWTPPSALRTGAAPGQPPISDLSESTVSIYHTHSPVECTYNIIL